MREAPLLYVCGCGSILFTSISVIITIICATSLNGSLTSLQVLSFISATMNVLSGLAVGSLELLAVWQINNSMMNLTPLYSKILVWGGIAMSCIAFLVTASALALFTVDNSLLPTRMYGQHTDVLYAGWAVTWTLSIAMQFCFHGFFAYNMRAINRSQNSQLPYTLHSTVELYPSSMPKRSTTMSTYNSRYTAASKTRPGTATTETYRSMSFRSSFSARKHAAVTHTELRTPRESREFDTHSRRSSDASSTFEEATTFISALPDSQERPSIEPRSFNIEPVRIPESAHLAPPRKLETIPASPRSAFMDTPPSPLEPVPRLQDPERSPSVSSNRSEEHIHPLFRSDSPTPAPNALPGTNVTAFPVANQTVSTRTIQRMRSGSLVNGASPLARSSASIDGGDRPAVIEIKEEAGEPQGLAIPGFILSAGSRSSFVEYGKRKENREQGDQQY